MNSSNTRHIEVVDSHTGGEPTRVVVAGGPNLGGGPLAERVAIFRERFDFYRSAIVNEPRGSDVLVGALLCEPNNPDCAAGVLFFNNVGFLGMCGHGTIGLLVTLAFLNRIAPGTHRIETPVGEIEATLHENNRVSVRNVPAYKMGDAQIELPGYGVLNGEIAWGGNWFFILPAPAPLLRDGVLQLADAESLTRFCRAVKAALVAGNITGAGGAEIDHIELTSPSPNVELDGRNYVLCPGDAYDRSPCGTGTSAKIACLFANGKLREGETWKQESITGSVFEGQIARVGDDLIPTITGNAFVNARATLILDESDPLCWGLREWDSR